MPDPIDKKPLNSPDPNRPERAADKKVNQAAQQNPQNPNTKKSEKPDDFGGIVFL